MTPIEALERAIKTAGTATALAAGINVAPSAPLMWKKRDSVPAEHCPAIERLTRSLAKDATEIVTCEQLRPGVAWDVLRRQAVGAATDEKAA